MAAPRPGGIEPATTAATDAPTRPLVDPGTAERGVTEIANRVVEKLAVALAGEVEGVMADPPRGGLRGALPGLGGGLGLDAHAEAGRRSARVALTIEVRYPRPAVEVADRVRDHVIDGLRRLTGLEVDELDITVRRLVVGGGRRRVV